MFPREWVSSAVGRAGQAQRLKGGDLIPDGWMATMFLVAEMVPHVFEVTDVPASQ